MASVEDELLRQQVNRYHLYKIWTLVLSTVLVTSGIVMVFIGIAQPGGELSFFGFDLSTESGGLLFSGLGVAILVFVFKFSNITWSEERDIDLEELFHAFINFLDEKERSEIEKLDTAKEHNE